MDKVFFEQGLTSEQFIELLGDNKVKFEQFLSDADADVASVLQSGAGIKFVAVIAEPWSGDVLYNLPPLLRIAEKAGWQVRIFRRDSYPEMILPYRKDGLYHSIPVFIFLDENYREVGNWVERPAAATKLIDDESLNLRRTLREKNKEAWRKETVKEIIQLAQC